MNRPLPTLSVVIPAYNEHEFIGRCLQALLDQADQLTEIIVVDNNSRDDTVHIVEAMQKKSAKIHLLHEPKQGAIAARDRGLDAAKSELIARIDADTIVLPGWAEAVRAYFDQTNYKNVVAASGPVYPHDAPFKKTTKWFIKAFFKSNGRHGDIGSLFGSNMIIRRDTWLKVRDEVCRRHDIMEDQDIAIHVTQHHDYVGYITDMEATVSSRRLQMNPIGYWRYQALWPNTYVVHGMYLVAARIWLLAILGNLIQLLVVVPTRAYNPYTERFSLTYLFGFFKNDRERELPYQKEVKAKKQIARINRS
ncbi:MAG TPA: glycosyltransferase family 2 protein [Candidatus Saccharimonadales bacterium]|nr:glycosyltransferase family 2 protein [Candidatus Saccharimonadales bacterium]